jgi:16S rRNA (guanine(966)-N(2))-methyltransferase RsmD
MTAQRRAVPHAVRIIGGRWKRSKLPVADAPDLRPTPDRVRETVFNWLGQDLQGWRCLDAFAGSGALGFEAASRGAAQVVLLERDRALAARLVQARDRLDAAAVRIEVADAVAWMDQRAGDAFDLIFIDPPFDTQLAQPALERSARLLAPQGRVYLESGDSPDPAALAALGWQIDREGRAGRVHYALLRRA